MFDRIKAVYGAVETVAAAHGSAAAELEAATEECLATIRVMDKEGAWAEACDQVEHRWNQQIARCAQAETQLQNASNDGGQQLNAADKRAASGFGI